MALLVLLALLTVRVAAAVMIAPAVVADAQGYDASAIRLERTGTFAYPLYSDRYWSPTPDGPVVSSQGRDALLSAPRNAYTMPGYPAFLAGVYRVFGDGQSRWLFARVLQAVISVATAALLFLIGRRFGDRVALIALGMSALYLPLTLANSYLLTEVFYSFLVTLFVYLCLRWLDLRTWWLAALAGAALGLGLWVRPVMAPWAILAGVAAIVAGRGDRPRLFRQVVVMGIMATLLVAPWWVRNYQIYRTFVPFGTYSSANVVEGLRRDVSDQLPFPWQSAQPSYSAQDRRIAAVVAAVNARASKTATDDMALQRYYDSAAPGLVASVIREEPVAAFLARSRSIATSIVWPYAVSPTTMAGVPFTVSWIVHLALLALFLLGLLSMPRRFDSVIIVSVPFYFLLFHAVVLPLHRYYFPVIPIALVVSAIGFDRLVAATLEPERMRNRRTTGVV